MTETWYKKGFSVYAEKICRKQFLVALPEPAADQLHSLQPGDYVVVKDFQRKAWHPQRHMTETKSSMYRIYSNK